MNRRFFFKALASGLAAATSSELFLPKLIKPTWKHVNALAPITLYDPMFFRFGPIAVDHLVKGRFGIPVLERRDLYDATSGVHLEYATEDIVNAGAKPGEIIDVCMGSNRHRVLVEDIYFSHQPDNDVGRIIGRLVKDKPSEPTVVRDVQLPHWPYIYV